MSAPLSPQQLRRAGEIATEIEQLEAAREDAQDTEVGLTLGAPTADRPMGGNYQADVRVLIPATTIRMVLVDKLTPLYTELRSMGIEYKKP